LLDAEARLAELQQVVIDQVVANEVSGMIAALPDLADITLDDEPEIVAARNAYDALTEKQKALMTNYQDLLDAEARLAELKSMVSASDSFSLLPFHLLSGAILLVGFLIKKRKQAQ
jgi:cell division protein FtsX